MKEDRDGKKRSIQIKKVSNKQELNEVFDIRRTVFVEEQGCLPELEWENEEDSTHFLALVDLEPAGAARWRPTDKGYKLERFAVLKAFRGLGVGAELVKAVIQDLPEDKNYVYLHAQVQASGLYEKFGFKRHGDEFEEAGIQHFKMVLQQSK